MASPTPPRLKVRLSPSAETAVRRGHPWVFAESVRGQNREGVAGEIAAIYDRRNSLLALAHYDPHSPIRLRVLHLGEAGRIDGEWWRRRLAAALAKRDGLTGAETTGFRCVNGESDGWPGLVLDRYDTTFVVKLYSAAWLPRIGEIVTLVRDLLPAARALVLRLSRHVGEVEAAAGSAGERFLFSEVDPPADAVVFLEDGLRFEALVRHGQKTGFFLDQRENRRRVGDLAAGRDVLNAFSFSGGFSVYAARGGASSVTDLDVSEPALAGARRHFALNSTDPRVAAARHTTVRADAFAWLSRRSDDRFDLIVVDPPSLAKRESDRAGAIAAYARLAGDAASRLRARGVLVAASCSGHVGAPEFFSAVRRGVRDAGRGFRERWTSGHAADHPATFPEAEYLKCICLELND